MEVLVRKPPVFTIEPEAMYQRKVSESVEMHCDSQEAEGTQKPTILWQRRDGMYMLAPVGPYLYFYIGLKFNVLSL